MKNFDRWNKKKKEIENRNIDNPKIMFCDRSIWWCSIGANIGIEQDGKGNNFERPVLILRKFNKYRTSSLFPKRLSLYSFICYLKYCVLYLDKL